MRKRKPIIGLTVYGPSDEQGYNLPAEYVHAIVAAGGVPMLLPPVTPDIAGDWLASIDGLVLAGGGDIDPRHYGSGSHATVYNLDAARDSTEMEVARQALRERKPTLAICRGMQIANVVLGGTLHLHLPEVFDDQVEHRVAPRDPVSHSVTVADSSRLAAIMGATQIHTSSWHHQALDRLGEGLTAVAWAEDGCIEAIEQQGNERLIAVQWHPEHTVDQDPTQRALFAALLVMASEEAERRCDPTRL